MLKIVRLDYRRRDAPADGYLQSLVEFLWAHRPISRSYANAAISVLGIDEDGPTGRQISALVGHRPAYYPLPLPDVMSAEVERQCWQYYYPRVEEADDGSKTFVVPPWFARGRMAESLRVVLDADGNPRSFIMCHQQALALLKGGPHTDRGRTSARYEKWTTTMRGQLTEVVGSGVLSFSGWLDLGFEDVEAAALHVWRELVATMNVPSSLDHWPLTLGVLYMCCTPERRYFAEHWPWAAFAATQTDVHGRVEVLAGLRRVDQNISSSVALADQLLGQPFRNDEAGAAARRALAKALPRIPVYDQWAILGQDPNSGWNAHWRHVLFGAHDAGATLPARLSRSEPSRIHQHLRFALEVRGVLEWSHIYDFDNVVGRLIAWMLVGTTTAIDVEADDVAQAFCRASSDCIALAASERFPKDALQAGVLALAQFFREGCLGFQQLVRWATEVVPPTDLRFKGDRSVQWPPPPAWDARFEGEHGVTPLQSIAEIVEEGELQHNCLARGFHHEAAVAGRIHILKVNCPGGRATLALREHSCPEQPDRVIDYSMAELKGAYNSEPTGEARTRCRALLRALKSRLPAPIPPDEQKRRREKRQSSYIKDPDVANKLWRDLYSAPLPRRLRRTSPRQIVDVMRPRSRGGGA